MRSFICDSCDSTLFFENDTCLACGETVGFRPAEMAMSTAAAAAAVGLRRCRNWTEYGACNWFADARWVAAEGYCLACGLNDVVPDLGNRRRRGLWAETERAKRRLIYSLLQLGLPLQGSGVKRALRFRLLADERVDSGAFDPPVREPVHMGHYDGCLTLDVGEADDAHREAIRTRMHEPYRTMLGHLRHETGHYYWYALVEGTLLSAFRTLFGDERGDYEGALRSHYHYGPPAGWQQGFISAYASAHPWEDFAETWAHYIHMLDTLDTASAAAIAIGGQAISSPLPLGAGRSLASILDAWRPLSVCLNQLNRSMGMRDAYPFALADRVIEKLTFVHELCLGAARGGVLAQTGIS